MSGAGDEIFTRRTAAWLLGLSAASLAATLISLALSGQVRAGDSPQANAFSRSSIGYRALIELLEAGGVDVVVSRFRSAEKAGPSAPLLLAEPHWIDDGPHGLSAQIRAAEARGAPVVVVLPRHWGTPAGTKEGWIEAVDEAGDPEEALAIVAGEGCALAPPAAPSRWSSALPGGELPALPEAAPLLPQLVSEGCGLEPLLWSDAGVLVGQVPGRAAIVVADPDLLDTWGLAHGDNAVIAHRLFVEHLGARSLVVDEVTHGYQKVPSIWSELLTLPLLPVTLHALGLTLLALAAAALRFGRPLPLPPRVPPGKRALVESTAELLDGGGHHAESVRHYLRMTLRHTASALGLPPGDDPLPALAALGRARDARADIAALAREADELPRKGPRAAAAALALARAVDTWRKEILHEHR